MCDLIGREQKSVFDFMSVIFVDEIPFFPKIQLTRIECVYCYVKCFAIQTFCLITFLYEKMLKADYEKNIFFLFYIILKVP